MIRRDKINVSYIIALLRSKKELIERFIANNFPNIPKGGDIDQEFENYWSEEKQKAIKELSDTEGLEQEGLQKVIGDYLFTEKSPMRDDVIGIMQSRPGLRERGTISARVIAKIKAFVETFIDGVD